MSAEVWLWLADGLGYGAVNSGELLSAYPGGAEEVAADLGSEKLDEILTQKQAQRLAASRPADFALRIAHAEGQGVAALGFDDKNYPDMLRGIHNPPPVLFVKGDLGLLNGQLSIGIVGARRPSAYGVEAVKAIGRGVAMGGAIIVSGLAAGLDSEAHKAALAVNGPTIACIAFGHDTCYPSSNKKLMEVIEKYGAVVSEYPLGTTAEKPYFLHRNRIIAGLSHGLVVAEARRHSGTMSTVNFATDYGRDVFAVPGSIFSELSTGTNDMIREGAYLAGSASDILLVYGIELQDDPVEAAAKQAEEGRPKAAAASPAPWQKNLSWQPVRRETQQPETQEPAEKPWAKTLAEALQRELAAEGKGDGPVSSKAAVEAFRRLQNTLPPTGDSEVEARNQALDEMVAAVSDTVDFSGRGDKEQKQKKKTSRKQKDEPQIEPFPWNRVEHLSKEEIAKMDPSRQNRDAVPAPARPQTVPVKPAREPVGRVERVSRVEAAMPVTPMEDVKPVRPGDVRFAPAGNDTANRRAAPEKPIRPREDVVQVRRKDAREPAGGAYEQVPDSPSGLSASFLADKLRTLESDDMVTAKSSRVNMEPQQEKPLPKNLTHGQPEETPINDKAVDAFEQADLFGHLDMDETEQKAKDPLSEMSDAAKKAFAQLGATPVSLSQICEGSGLSPGAAMAALTELELAGLSRQLAGRQFVIMQ